LRRELTGHDISTAPKMGWAGLKNGALLVQAVAGGFEAFVTVDKNLPKQQKLETYAIAVVVLRCATNDIRDLQKLVPELLTKLPNAKKGEATVIG
jgi:hypothetical protein